VSILALDPGLEHPALAYYTDRLIWAQRVKLPGEYKSLGILDRSDRVARACLVRAHEMHVENVTLIIVEFPQWYAADKSKGDPNDLAALAAIAGSVTGRVRGNGGRCGFDVRVDSPRPREVWGNVPKVTKGDPWVSPRGQKLARRLTAVERAGVQDKHDALDAAGLALFAAGRWKQIRVYPGAV
jgi:hypothetical protein